MRVRLRRCRISFSSHLLLLLCMRDRFDQQYSILVVSLSVGRFVETAQRERAGGLSAYGDRVRTTTPCNTLRAFLFSCA